MKNLNQFATLTEAEVINTNGGGTLDDLLGTIGPLVNGATAPLNILATGVSTAIILAGNGANSALTNVGNGLVSLLGKLSLPGLPV